MPEAIKIKSMKDKTGKVTFSGTKSHVGFGSKKYTAEEKKKIKEETQKHVRSGQESRKKTLGLNLDDNEISGLSEGQQLLLARINKLSENKSFEKIKDKDRLKKVLQFIPDLDEYPAVVLRAIIDNKKIDFKKISRENEDLLLELITKIMDIPNLRSIFNQKDLLYVYGEVPEQEMQDFLKSMPANLQQFQEKVDENDEWLAEKLHELGSQSTDKEKFKELKKILPKLQSKYNESKGNRLNQTIVKLGPDKLNDFAPYVFSLKENSERMKQLVEYSKRVEDELNRLDDEYSTLHLKYEEEAETLKIITENYKDLESKISSQLKGLKFSNLETFLAQLLEDKTAIDTGSGPRVFPSVPDSQIEDDIVEVQKWIIERNEFIDFGKRTNKVIDELQQRLNHIGERMDARYRELENYQKEFKQLQRGTASKETVVPTPMTPKTPAKKGNVSSIFQGLDTSTIDDGTRLDDSTFLDTTAYGSVPGSPTGATATGSGLRRDKSAPYGRLKNGKPRKHPRKNEKVYKPRNKLHWLQAKDENNRFIGGSLIAFPEIEQKLLNLKQNNFQQKALDMLDSVRDILTYKEYQDIFQKLIS